MLIKKLNFEKRYKNLEEELKKISKKRLV